MLNHQKLIIINIKSDKKTLKKELEKSADWLTTEELEQLYYWLKNELDLKYFTHIINNLNN